MITEPRASQNAAIFLLISCGLSVGCKKSAQLEERIAPSTASSSSPSLASAQQPIPSGSASAAVESDEPKSGAIGDWLDENLYRFRLESIKRCADPKHADAGGARFAVLVAVAAKVDQVFVSPRAFSLEQGGVIVQAELDPGTGCGKPLPSKQLKAGEQARGVVVIAAPDDEFAKKSKLAFRPTRWGGAPPVLVSVPACLDACR